MSKEKMKKLSLERHLDINIAQSGCSWNSAFATASSVQLEQLDDDFLERTQSQKRDKGLAAVAELVKQVAKDKNTKIDEADGRSHIGSSSTYLTGKMVAKDKNTKIDKADGRSHIGASSTCLTGKMVVHPISKEDLMILVNEETKDVYSALQRDDSGNFIKIARVRPDGSIEWRDHAFSETNKSKEQLFPFDTDPDDHCESPLDAYEDIVPLVESLFKKEECKIYDPYYCDGAVKRNLKTLGFPSVHNVKEDCYQIWSKGKVPKFNVLMTNPPYSEDHLPKLVAFLSSSAMKSKPWFLLMPQWVSKKPYFSNPWDKKAIFIVPKRRYVYYPPKNFRKKKASDVHKKSSPFVTIWFVWGGSLEKTRNLYDSFREHFKNKGTCDVARSKNGLRDLRRKGKRKRCDS